MSLQPMERSKEGLSLVYYRFWVPLGSILIHFVSRNLPNLSNTLA